MVTVHCLAARTQSCHVGGLGEEREERDELVEEMDTKIRELTEAVTSKDRELERLKETVRMLQEKVASSPRAEISAAKEGLRSSIITEKAPSRAFSLLKYLNMFSRCEIGSLMQTS